MDIKELRKKIKSLADLGEGMTPEQVTVLEKARQPQPERLSNYDEVRQDMAQTFAGVGEGLKQGVEGVFDFAEDLAVGMGLQTEEDRQKWKQSLNEDRFKRRSEAIAEFGRLPSGTAELVGEIAPWLYVVPSAGTTLTNTIAKRVLQGAAMGGSTVQEKEKTFLDRMGQMSLAAGIGGATGFFVTLDAAEKTAARAFISSYNESTAGQAELVQKMVREMTEDPTFSFSMAQVTGSRFVQGLEVSSAATATKDAQNNNLSILMRHILRTSEEMSGQGKSAGQIGRALRATMEKARSNIYSQAAAEWSSNMAVLLEKHGDEIVVDGKLLLAKVDKLLDESNDIFISVGGKPSANLIEYRNGIDLVVNPVEVQRVVTKLPDGTERVGWKTFDRSSGVEGPVGFNETAVRQKAAEMNEAFGGLDSSQVSRLTAGMNRLIGGETAIYDNAPAYANKNVGRALMGALIDELQTNP